MKKINLIIVLLVVVITACLQHNPEQVDIDAEKRAINEQLDKIFLSFEKQDVPTLSSLITDDAIIFGSAPAQRINKDQAIEIWNQMLSDTTYEFIVINERQVFIATDGYSATAIEEYLMPFYSTKIPFRNSYHLIKINDEWKIFCWNGACIPKDEDLPKLNAALE